MGDKVGKPGGRDVKSMDVVGFVILGFDLHIPFFICPWVSPWEMGEPNGGPSKFRDIQRGADLYSLWDLMRAADKKEGF